MKDQLIDPADALCVAHWCGHFSCSFDELHEAMAATRSEKVGVVALHLATRHERQQPILKLIATSHPLG